MTTAFLERLDTRAHTRVATRPDAAPTTSRRREDRTATHGTSFWYVMWQALSAARAASLAGPRDSVAIAHRFAKSI